MFVIFKIFNNNKCVTWTPDSELAVRIRNTYYPNGYIKIEFINK